MPHRRSRGRGLAPLVLLSLLIAALPLVSVAQSATPVASPVPSDAIAPLPPAWLEFGPHGQLLARVIVPGDCPSLTLDGLDVVMRPRANPSDAFPVVACEATVPFGVRSARVGNQTLPLPSGPFQRIAVIGDTGCRLNDWEKKFQACNDPTAWPFAQVAASVAAWQPDLIVHVGDYLYRESPCPATGIDCVGSPHGDNWPTWNADFFSPASPLLGVAPWVVMRGNHETCDRNPEGWFAYLDPVPFESKCQVYTDPYVIDLNGLTLAALDSAEASDQTVKPGEKEAYQSQFALLAELAPEGSWLVTHRPVWGVLEGTHGEDEVANATYQEAIGDSFKGQYALILSGHIHLAEALAFRPSSERPLQIISGNAGTALDNVPTASPTASQLGDPSVEEAETLSSFGFLTLEPDRGHWLATQRDASGTPLLVCQLLLPEMGCAPPA